MSLLSTTDLSALMRTCRYFLDVALLPLCARAQKDRMTSGRQVAAFFRFLRVDSGPSARNSLVKELWFNLSDDAPTYDRNGRPTYPNVDMFLGLLRNCRKIERLRIDNWFTYLPAPFLIHTISTSLPSLSELVIHMRQDLDRKAVTKIARLPLRKLHLKRCGPKPIPDLLVALQPLARTLVDLDIPTLAPTRGTCFPNVRMLGVTMTRRQILAEDLVATFPNLTHLTIGYVEHEPHLPVSERVAQEQCCREANRKLWEKHPDAWPNLQAIRARDVLAMYCLGLPRHVPRILLAAEAHRAGRMVPAIMADAQPNSVELSVSLGRREGLVDGLGLVPDTHPAQSPHRLVLRVDSEWLYSEVSYMEMSRDALVSVGLPCRSYACFV
ncbi:hypothetical protein C8Q76DRAFT_733145, partial [Earliella scabrosa]